jgi:hypothetical protein
MDQIIWYTIGSLLDPIGAILCCIVAYFWKFNRWYSVLFMACLLALLNSVLSGLGHAVPSLIAGALQMLLIQGVIMAWRKLRRAS